MMTRRIWSTTILLASISALLSARAQKPESLPENPAFVPVLINTCLITNNVKRLVDFYESVLTVRAKWSGSRLC